MAKPNVIRVVLIEDDENFRFFFQRRLVPEPDISVVGCYPNPETFLAALEEMTVLPDVVVTDLRIAGAHMDGIEGAVAIRQRCSGIKVVALTGMVEARQIRRAKKAGMKAFLWKDGSQAELLEGIRLAAQGRSFIAPSIYGVVWSCIEEPALSDQEERVLSLVEDGKSDKEIAQELGVSQSWVEKLKVSFRRKLGAVSTAQAVRKSADS